MRTKTRNGKIDMTAGPIMPGVLLFALPLLLGNVLQQLYTTVDTLVIGQYCGTSSLAAVGTSSQPVEVLLCVFLGIGTGVSILMSQYVGAGDREQSRSLCQTAVTFVWGCGIPVGILGWFAAPAILQFMNVPADAAPAAVSYTRIVLAGALGNIGFNMNAGILRGLGNSTASLLFLLVSCLSNIVLDVVFVAGLGMDVRGAALATAISMYLSWFASILYVRHYAPEQEMPVLPRRCSPEQLRSIVSIGLPIGLNNSLYSVGHMAMQTMVNAQGSVFMAGNAIASRITGLSNVAISGMSSAATTFAGQNYGAGQYGRLQEGSVRIPLWSGLITLSLALVCLGFRAPVLRFFSSDAEVLRFADRYVVVIMLSQWIFAVFNAIVCVVNGVGEVRVPTLVSLLMLWAVRIPSAFLIRTFYDGTWIMLCFPISFVFGMVCMIGYIAFSHKWRALCCQTA